MCALQCCDACVLRLRSRAGLLPRRCCAIRRREAVRRAGAKYQGSPVGARKRAARQRQWANNRAQKVTHHGFHPGPPLFDNEGLRRVLANAHGRTARPILEDTFRALEMYELSDDATLLVVRQLGEAEA